MQETTDELEQGEIRVTSTEPVTGDRGDFEVVATHHNELRERVVQHRFKMGRPPTGPRRARPAMLEGAREVTGDYYDELQADRAGDDQYAGETRECDFCGDEVVKGEYPTHLTSSH